MFTNYNKCLEYLFGLERTGIKYDLKNIKTLLQYLGNPHKELKAIHIAGTNGKGTVASMINSFLIEKNFKTGLYISPHILDFRERILINGNLISKKFIIDFTNKILPLIEKISPSFFEVTTAMAFYYFKKNNVDYAVVECGLGGRLDSTNVLRPILSVITGISIDHTEYLGNTIEKIAYEKAGIIKKNIPLVTGFLNKKSGKIIRKKCKEKNCELIKSSRISLKNIFRLNDGFIFDICYNNCIMKNIKFPIIGDYHLQNISTTVASLIKISESENFHFNFAELKSALSNFPERSKFYGRFQVLTRNLTIVIDVSHNVEGLSNLQDNLRYLKYERLVIIFGIMKDKDIKRCIKEIEKLNSLVILTTPAYKRAICAEDMKKFVRNRNSFIIKNDIISAFKYAYTMTDKKDLILITGSFFLVSEFLKFFSEYYLMNTTEIKDL
ncbi:MAG: bifunctional folylpolyglutamate synthase/dihydrofolate synthase [Ignavibacteria bacterium]|nr:bifunctional folylpolyglutamate synthase/dihydrofolate synthase [Ignavibacteria bacterium]